MGSTVVFLNGSPRGRNSTSYALGKYLCDRLSDHKWDQSYFHLTSANLESDASGLLAAVESADLIVLAAPLYVDSAPAPVIKAMEIMASRASRVGGGSRLVAISNCGFPEWQQNLVAMDIYRLFAREAGLTWSGGLAIGTGPMIGSVPLANRRGPASRARRALDLAASALVQGDPIPDQAQRLLSVPFIPIPIYRLVLNVGFSLAGRSSGISGKGLRARPYAE